MNCLLFDSIKALVCLLVALLSRDDEFPEGELGARPCVRYQIFF